MSKAGLASIEIILTIVGQLKKTNDELAKVLINVHRGKTPLRIITDMTTKHLNL